MLRCIVVDAVDDVAVDDAMDSHRIRLAAAPNRRAHSCAVDMVRVPRRQHVQNLDDDVVVGDVDGAAAADGMMVD